nr:hypothetical protein [Tanacetum cinerariifolium]
MITEEVVREILQLNDAEGVICLPNEEIFAGLARMGYEKPSTKMTFYKAFFSTQWKFFIHIILHSLIAKRTSWNKFSSAMASTLICLSSGQRFNFSKYIFESLVRNVDRSSKFYMYPRFIQLIIQTNIDDLSKHTTRYSSPVLTQKVFANMRKVRKGFSGVETPLFESMLAQKAAKRRKLSKEAQEADDLRKRLEIVQDKDDDVFIEATPLAQKKAAKRRKLSKEAQEADDLRKRLEIVQDEDDDVFIEATPLAQKVPVVDYQIVVIDNKPKYKISRADDTHQFYISFTTLLKNFDKEDLETLWKISVHGLALVKRWKLLISCGVHVITLSTVQLFLLVERRVDAARLKLKLFKDVAAVAHAK